MIEGNDLFESEMDLRPKLGLTLKSFFNQLQPITPLNLYAEKCH